MQPMSFPVARRPRRPRGTMTVAATLLVASAIVGTMTARAAAACPWVVQPYAQSLPVSSGAPTFDIVFDGIDPRSRVFYGFTAASLDLAFQLASQQALPDALPDARRLEPKETPFGTTAYQLAPDTIQPHTVYLVAAGSAVDALEAIDARIEPARPVAVSQLLPRTRGGTDWSGPLPHRSLPGFEIADGAGAQAAAGAADSQEIQVADLQICAYQVALR